MAIERQFDIGVIFSMDTDLAPALEFVKSLNDPSITPVTAAWYGEGAVSHIPGVWCHRLTREDYLAIHDPTNYAPPESLEDMAARLQDSWEQAPE